MMISVSVSGFICLALAAGIFIPARGSVFGSIPFALAAGVFITFMVLVLGFIPLTLAAGVFIAFMVLVSALSAGNLKAIRTKLFEPKPRGHGTGSLQKPKRVPLENGLQHA